MLNQNDIRSFEEQLKNSLAATEKTLKHLEGGLDFGDDIDHFDEEADEAEELANRAGMKEKLQERMDAINRALLKIKAGTYGKCEKCGETIDLETLHASPESELCRDCKKKR